ncbi:hypothetical protein [Kineococcus sp. NPDC059986]|uniref:hypothetical protein n=1 Tax=Kineococcus sp. NPDC059986 TaxID=3155538 RepID=UPI00344DE507
MAGRGGYQAPAKPAAVSGPGALSQRTDGQPVRDITGGDYGDGAEMRNLQQSAPLAKAPNLKAGSAQAQASALSAMTPFGAPSSMPDVPVTSGAAVGAGPGVDALGLGGQNYQDALAGDMEFMRQYLPAMLSATTDENSSPAFRQYVRSLIARS